MAQKMCSGEHTLRICGMGNIGSKGQVVIPKEARDTLGLNPGDSVTFVLKDEKMLGIVPNHSIDALVEFVASEKNVTLIK